MGNYGFGVLEINFRLTLGRILCHISMVNIVLALLYTEDSDDITAASITAIIIPTIPVGNRLNTNLKYKR